MEREELLNNRNTGVRMKGISSDISSDESDEIEIFNRKRRGNQGKSCEAGGVLLVLLCLTFFATTIIFGARYMSALKTIERLEIQLGIHGHGEHETSHDSAETPGKSPHEISPTQIPKSNNASDSREHPAVHPTNNTANEFATNSSTHTMIRRITLILLSVSVTAFFQKAMA